MDWLHSCPLQNRCVQLVCQLRSQQEPFPQVPRALFFQEALMMNLIKPSYKTQVIKGRFVFIVYFDYIITLYIFFFDLYCHSCRLKTSIRPQYYWSHLSTSTNRDFIFRSRTSHIFCKTILPHLHVTLFKKWLYYAVLHITQSKLLWSQLPYHVPLPTSKVCRQYSEYKITRSYTPHDFPQSDIRITSLPS